MKLSAIITCIFITALLILAGCERVSTKALEEAPKTGAQAKEGQMTETLTPPANVAVATMTIHTTQGAMNFSVEIAESDEERSHGLMWRESLPDNSGMWFVFPQTVQERFWMKDTKIPLDLIFVGEDMKVVHIIENALPESTELLSSPVPFRYVMETKAGTAARGQIKPGDLVEKRIGP